LHIGVQLDSALTDLKGAINFIRYRQNSAIAKKGNKEKLAEGIVNSLPITITGGIPFVAEPFERGSNVPMSNEHRGTFHSINLRKRPW